MPAIFKPFYNFASGQNVVDEKIQQAEADDSTLLSVSNQGIGGGQVFKQVNAGDVELRSVKTAIGSGLQATTLTDEIDLNVDIPALKTLGLVGTTDIQTLTNKTIDATLNTIGIRPDELEVSSTTLADKALLRYNGSQWEITPTPIFSVASDMEANGPSVDKQILSFDGGAFRWKNQTLDNANIVAKTGSQSIAGLKTFTNAVVDASNSYFNGPFQRFNSLTANSALYLDATKDIKSVTAGTEGQVLKHISGIPKWETPSAGGATDLNGLSDCTITAPVLNNVLRNDGAGQFINDTADNASLVDKTTAQTIQNKTINSAGGNNIQFNGININDASTRLTGFSNGNVAKWTAGGAINSIVQTASSGNLTSVSNGTLGHVLTSNGAGSAPTFQAGGGGTDADAIHKSTGGEIVLITAKNPAVDADLLLIEDSADANNKKRVRMDNTPFVHLTGNQSNIAGIKKFTDNMVINDEGFTTTNPNLSIQNSAGSAFMAMQPSGGITNESLQLTATTGTISDITLANQRSGKIAFNTGPTDNTAVERLSINNAGVVAINQLGTGITTSTGGVISSTLGTAFQVLQTNAGATNVEWTTHIPGEVNTGANVGPTGLDVFRDKTGAQFNFRKVGAGSGMSVAYSGDSIVLTNTAANNSIEGLNDVQANVNSHNQGLPLQWDTEAGEYKFKHINFIDEIAIPASMATKESGRYETKKFTNVNGGNILSILPVEDINNVKVYKTIPYVQSPQVLGDETLETIISGTAYSDAAPTTQPKYYELISGSGDTDGGDYLLYNGAVNGVNFRFNYNFGQKILFNTWEYRTWTSSPVTPTFYEVYGSNTSDMTSIAFGDTLPADSILLFSSSRNPFIKQDEGTQFQSTSRFLTSFVGNKTGFQYVYTKMTVPSGSMYMNWWRPYAYSSEVNMPLIESTDYTLGRNATTGQPEITMITGTAEDIQVNYSAVNNFITNDIAKIVRDDNLIVLDQIKLKSDVGVEEFNITDDADVSWFSLDIVNNLTSMLTQIVKSQKTIQSAVSTYVSGSPNTLNVHDNTIIIAIGTTNTVILPSPTHIGSEYIIIDSGLNARAITTNELIIQVPTSWTLNGVTDGSRTIISDGGFVKCLYSGGTAYHVTGFDL